MKAPCSFLLYEGNIVAHGLSKDERQIMYDEMKRVTKQLVIIYDYTDKRGIITDVLEWLEGGDYFNFIIKVQSELNENFGQTKIITANKQSALYVLNLT